MGSSSEGEQLHPGAAGPRPDDRLRRLLELAGDAARAALRLEPAGSGGFDVAPGWELSGGAPPESLEAIASLVHRAFRAETELDSLSGEILERYEEASLVYRLAGRLGEALGEPEITRAVIEEAARVLGAHRGGIWLRRDGRLELAAQVPAGPWDAGARSALEDAVCESEPPWLREQGPRGEPTIAVPLADAGERPLGALVLEGRDGGRTYRTGELKLLTALATVASAFVRNGRLAAKARKADVKRREDEIAREIHRGLLPRDDPSGLAGLDVAGACRAADAIGGDYYGFLPMDGGSLGLALADVTGHGVAAGLYMAGARMALQSEARGSTSPARILERANRVLEADFGSADVFATAFFARLAPGGRHLAYANAGQNPPLLLRSGGEVLELTHGGTALGLLPDVRYEEASCELAPGDLLVAYTDGLVEARNRNGAFFGVERVVELARRPRASAAEIRGVLFEALDRHLDGASQQDDVTVVVARAIDADAATDRQGRA